MRPAAGDCPRSTATLYAFTIDHIPQVRHGTGNVGIYLVELRCETCDEVHRFTLDDDRLDAVRAIAHASTQRQRVPLASLVTRELTETAADVVSAMVWQLTHATAHAEAERRAPREVTT